MIDNYNVIELLNDYTEIDPTITDILQELEIKQIIAGTKLA